MRIHRTSIDKFSCPDLIENEPGLRRRQISFIIIRAAKNTLPVVLYIYGYTARDQGPVMQAPHGLTH